MDLQYVLLNPNGRIAQREFWIGMLMIVLGNVFLTPIPLLGGLVWLVLIYVGVCVYGKRLHDAGRSAWVHMIPWAITGLLVLMAVMIAGATLLSRMLSGGDINLFNMFALGGALSMLAGFGNLVWLIYTLWVGLSAGQAGANAYGPAPIRILTAEPPAPSDEQG
ncbi:DUF805 domain-containing protein [Maricaulis sp.]|uniref:DUF805 domain-containing protein n=1 Tax=Maricaulis sp. TaxID=1486257 RepID=UPI001B00AE32|nr:DUF805 domain-containing protein [Maricaulis sp.]MBO6765138.1 DUF805 domain-containing protein [Maricaulis sp.]